MTDKLKKKWKVTLFSVLPPRKLDFSHLRSYVTENKQAGPHDATKWEGLRILVLFYR